MSKCSKAITQDVDLNNAVLNSLNWPTLNYSIMMYVDDCQEGSISEVGNI